MVQTKAGGMLCTHGRTSATSNRALDALVLCPLHFHRVDMGEQMQEGQEIFFFPHQCNQGLFQNNGEGSRVKFLIFDAFLENGIFIKFCCVFQKHLPFIEVLLRILDITAMMASPDTFREK